MTMNPDRSIETITGKLHVRQDVTFGNGVS